MTDHDTDKKDKKSKYSLSERLAKFTATNPYEYQQTFQKPVPETKPDADDDAIGMLTPVFGINEWG